VQLRKTRVTLFGCIAGVAVVVPLIGTGCLSLRTPSPTELSGSAQLATAPPGLSEPVTLRVLTMNVWGLKFLSDHRAERMPAIGARLAQLKPDLIGFQEAFVKADREVLLTALSMAGLVHHRYFPSGFVGSGLLVVSRYPIEEAFFRRYTAGGKAYRVDHGDWWAGKGVCLIRIRLPGSVGYIDFFNTHAHASYGEAMYDPVRQSNMEDLAAFIARAATGTSPALVVGDFNVKRHEQQYRTLVERARLTRLMAVDSWIDHIFAQENSAYRHEVLDTTIIDDKIPVNGKSIRLSDHKGYMSTIRITPVTARPATDVE